MAFKLICVAGARPNFMKVAPLVRELRGDPAFSVVFLHTGQHYDESMSNSFLRELELNAPEYNLEVGSGSHAQQTAEIMRRFEPVILAERPAAVVVVGDVNSTVACALVAAKLGVAVVHVEAGLRSFDRAMPEEINRVLTDAISDLLLVTEESGRRNLLHEGIPAERIHLVGNLMIDSLRRHLEQARQSDILDRLGLRGERFGVVTLHRPANVDSSERLQDLLSALEEIGRDATLYFPAHPRTQARLNQLPSAPSSRIVLLPPLGYLDFLCLMASSAIVLTDSGGIQEETTVLGVPCLTLRDNTERPVTVEMGTNTLAGTSAQSIVAAWETVRNRPARGSIPPLWDGGAADRCRQVLRDFFCRQMGPES